MKIIWLLFFSSSLLFSQIFPDKKYNTGSGLVQPTVRALSQDSLGRIWIGTAEGLSIYDGNSFTNFKRNDGLTNDVINCFQPVAPNIMLVGTNGGGIACFAKIPFSKDSIIKIIDSKKFLTGNYISNIYRDRRGNYWICTEGGITRWKIKGADITGVKNFGKDLLGKYHDVSSVVEERNGSLIFATGMGLLKFKNAKIKKIPFKNIPRENITLLFKDGKGNLLLSSSHGTYFFSQGNLTTHSGKRLLYRGYSIGFLETVPGQIWTTNSNGVLRYNESSNKITEINQFKDLYCTALLKDKEGNIWIGTLDGLNKIPDYRFTYLNDLHQTLGINKIARDKKNKMWVTSINGLFTIAGDKIVRDPLNSLLGSRNIRPILFDKGSVWIGSARGLYKILHNKSKVFSKADGLPGDFIYSLGKDRFNNILAGTDFGLGVICGGKVLSSGNCSGINKNYYSKLLKDLPVNRVSAILTDHKGNLWLGYWSEGLYKISGDSLVSFSKRNGLFDRSIRGLYQDKGNNIWIGTRYGGVYKYDGEKFTHYTDKEGLGSNFVTMIYEDNGGRYWFGTAKGIAMFNGRYWKRFDESDGINSSGILSIASDTAGNIYFACHKGVYIYGDPEKDYSNNKAPDVYIKDIRLNNGKFLNAVFAKRKAGNKVLSLDNFSKPKKILLKYRQNSLHFEFYADSYKNELKTKYIFKLKGFDKSWSHPTSRSYITYTHLPAGDYSFEVKAINSDGIISSKPAKFSFEILPPFWQTWWFISLGIAFITALISGITILIYKYRISQIIKMERIRTGIATDLHDDLGTSLSRISIFSQLAKRELKNQSGKIFYLLDKIENSSRDLVDSMNDIIWSINPENDSLEDAILKMENFAVELLEAKGMEVSITIPADTNKIELPLEKRRQLLLIFKEMINNTAKHSGAEKVRINLELSTQGSGSKPGGIKITVKDDGKGFDTNQIFEGNGLKNMRHRAKSLEGSFEINSECSGGTDMRLFIPI